MRAMTIRLSEDDADMLETIAQAEGRSMSSLLQEAVAALLQQRRRDPALKERIFRHLNHDQALLRRLRI
jgi:predicted transcriptional regulator